MNTRERYAAYRLESKLVDLKYSRKCILDIGFPPYLPATYLAELSAIDLEINETEAALNQITISRAESEASVVQERLSSLTRLMGEKSESAVALITATSSEHALEADEEHIR